MYKKGYVKLGWGVEISDSRQNLSKKHVIDNHLGYAKTLS